MPVPMNSWMVDPNMWAQFPPNFVPIIGLIFFSKFYSKLYILDHQMRKKLPAWILEGLEKAEKEKQKKLEKEEMENKRKELENEKAARREAKGLGKFVCF